MAKEERELLSIDLSARLRYGVICQTPKGRGHLCSINQTIFGTEYGVNILATERDYFNDADTAVKPYLRSMDSMTEEEEREYDATFDTIYVNGHYDSVMTYKSIDWLNKNMFDYRGLIPLGLAIEAQEGMYNNKMEE